MFESSLRTCLPVAAVPILLWLQLSTACTTQTSSPAPVEEWLYVSNEDSGDLSIVSTLTHEVVATIPVGLRPRGLQVSSDGRTIYVALSGSPKCPPWISEEECAQKTTDKSKDGIGVVDVPSRKLVRVLQGGSDPEQFDLSLDETLLFVANEDVGFASVVEIRTGDILATVEVGTEPEGVRVSPDGKLVFVTSESDHLVTVIDSSTFTVLHRVPVDLRPRDVRFTSDGSRALVSAETAGKVTVVDIGNGYAPRPIDLPEGARPMGLAVSPDDRRLYVANGRHGTVSVVDLATETVIESLEVGRRPWGLALGAEGRRLYTANGPSNDVSVVDTAEMKVVRKIEVGDSPWGLAIGRRPDAP